MLFFTHDLLRTPPALDKVVGAVRPGGLIATAGVRRPPGWVLPAALPLLALMHRYVTTTEGLHEPWDLLADRLRDTDVELHVLGIIYVASGTRPGERGAE